MTNQQEGHVDKRAEVALRVAERLKITLCSGEHGGDQQEKLLCSVRDHALPVWDALVSSEMRMEAQESALVELRLEKREDCLVVAELRARVGELEEALREIDETLTGTLPVTGKVKAIVRAALAEKEE